MEVTPGFYEEPEHPVELPDSENYEFDMSLYERTIKRMEKIIYGQTPPSAREISAAEALVQELLKTRMKWWQKLKQHDRGI